MKKLLLLICFPLLLACEDDGYQTDNRQVNKFVDALIEGKYVQNYLDPLPAFTEQDIPAILEYAQDYREIPYFPVNPISSFAAPTFRLGECLLWVVEAIRITDRANNQLDYPSHLPVLIKDNNLNSPNRLTEDELNEVYALYTQWWEDNQQQNFNNFRNVNPLESSNYRWR